MSGAHPQGLVRSGFPPLIEEIGEGETGKRTTWMAGCMLRRRLDADVRHDLVCEAVGFELLLVQLHRIFWPNPETFTLVRRLQNPLQGHRDIFGILSEENIWRGARISHWG